MARKQTRSLTRSDGVRSVSPGLIEDIRQIIGVARRSVATTVDTGLTLLFWRIGKRIVDEFRGKERAAYGQRLVLSVSRQLVQEYGPNFGENNLPRVIGVSALMGTIQSLNHVYAQSRARDTDAAMKSR